MVVEGLLCWASGLCRIIFSEKIDHLLSSCFERRPAGGIHPLVTFVGKSTSSVLGKILRWGMY